MKLGLYQCQAGTQEPEIRLGQINRCLRDDNLDLLVCPELFLSGYAPGQALHACAEPQDGPFGQRVSALARQFETAVAYGYPERADDRLYNSVALYDASGALIANHRKRLPSPGSFEETAFAKGGEVTFANLGDWRVAVIICYEVEFPENLRRAAQGGAQLVLVPTALGADWGVVAEKVVGTRAYENGIWIAYSDQAGVADGLAFYGGSRIVAPDGRERVVAGDAEALITATLDLETVHRMQARLPFLRDCKRL